MGLGKTLCPIFLTVPYPTLFSIWVDILQIWDNSWDLIPGWKIVISMTFSYSSLKIYVLPFLQTPDQLLPSMCSLPHLPFAEFLYHSESVFHKLDYYHHCLFFLVKKQLFYLRFRRTFMFSLCSLQHPPYFWRHRRGWIHFCHWLIYWEFRMSGKYVETNMNKSFCHSK